MTRRSICIVAAAALVATTAVVFAGTAAGGRSANRSRPAERPIVFVHGFSGSGAQFETQALRFTSNGYPASSIAVHEYDSLFGVETREEVFARLDDRIGRLLKHSGAKQIDLLGHSLGTSMMQQYLSSAPERAAKVAHYVNLDGATATAPPGGVETLAIWGNGDPTRKIAGAANTYFTNQTHTEVVTSPETFEEIYTFFTGREPKTTDVVPEDRSRLRLSGRAVLFPQNTGVPDATLEIHEVNGATGARTDDDPEATYELGGDGSWGPFASRPGRNYEFAIVREGAATHHIYFEPFTRSDAWVRLLTSPVDGGIGDLIEAGERHAAINVVRYKEWWGDQGANSDLLEFNGVNVLNPTNAPLSKRAIAVFAFDVGSDGVTDLTTPTPGLSALPFITGVDLFLPVAEPPNESISIASTTRGAAGHVDVVNVPNWRSSDHRISVHFNEYLG
jgi:pimeloyl-ACP methyl ester carboxylesterase